MLRVFISYAREDVEYQRLLRRFLVSADDSDLQVEVISDQNLLAGDRWEERLNTSMEEVDAGVLLLSTYFLESQWCKSELMRLAERGLDFPLIPILVSPCRWLDVPVLKARNAICGDGPASQFEDQEALWFQIANQVRAVLPTRREQSHPATENEWSRISKAIKQGLFTPIIGPGCYEVTEDTREARNHLRTRLEWILAKLDDDAGACDFVRGVVGSNLLSVLHHRLDQIAQPHEDWMLPLVDLQTALSKLGASCCRFIGGMMQERPSGFTDVHAVTVSMKSKGYKEVEEKVTELRNVFFAAVQKASALNHYVQKNHRSGLNKGLGSAGILGQLVILTYSVFHNSLTGDDADDQAREWLDENRASVATAERFLRQARTPIADKLAITQLEWIGDLVWHTIRFEAPMYPSPDELAFQLSVCLGTVMPPKKERMGTMVELTDEELCQRLIRKFYRVYDRGRSNERPRLYDVLARALSLSSRGAVKPLAKIHKGTARRGLQDFRKSVTVAISTNFDRELERSLEERHADYHLVIPVFVPNEVLGNNGPAEDYSACWMMRTFSWDEDDRREPENVLLSASNQLNEIALNGPLLVKLHGSPLEPLQSGYMHRLWISDRDFIEAMVARDRFWPPGLKELLEAQERVLCFVGYPLADTGSRLRLSDHLKREKDNRTLYFVDYPEDPLRHALLKRIRGIKVGLIQAKIDELPQLLLNLLDQTSDRESGARS